MTSNVTNAKPSIRLNVKHLLSGPFMVVWFVLIAATLVAWYLASDHGIHNHHTATVAILLVAFIKVRFVGLYFMELQDAPVTLRVIFEVFCAIVCAIMIGVYLVGPLAPS